jgi:DNA repair exonuclease SbcCD nuclease subunit
MFVGPNALKSLCCPVVQIIPTLNKAYLIYLILSYQNRAKHNNTNYIPEQFLDDFLDLVIWGHEHECRVEPEWNATQNFYVSQPGSSVATSLSEGETKPKAVGLLEINGKDFRMTRLPLETVRQFYMDDIALCDTTLDPMDHNIAKQVEAYCVERVEALIEKAGQWGSWVTVSWVGVTVRGVGVKVSGSQGQWGRDEGQWEYRSRSVRVGVKVSWGRG